MGRSGAAASATASVAGSSVNVSDACRGFHADPPASPQLSPQQLAGQRVIFGYHGLTPPASLLAKIRAGEVAGVIFFKGNVSSLTQITRGHRRAAERSRAEPGQGAAAADDRPGGGIVRRLPGAPLLSEKQIGASAHPAVAARQAGHNAGLLLRSVGMNVNLAPVLDVYRVAGDFIDQYRTLLQRRPADRGGARRRLHHGPAADRRGRHRQTLSRPRGGGHGAEHRRATGDAERCRWPPCGPSMSCRTAPRSAPGCASSWSPGRSIQRSMQLDLPASPRPSSQGELRTRLGFTGVTITDALGAGALRPFGTIADRAVLAAGAGMDLLLCASQSQASAAAQRVSRGAEQRSARQRCLQGLCRAGSGPAHQPGSLISKRAVDAERARTPVLAAQTAGATALPASPTRADATGYQGMARGHEEEHGPDAVARRSGVEPWRRRARLHTLTSKPDEGRRGAEEGEERGTEVEYAAHQLARRPR